MGLTSVFVAGKEEDEAYDRYFSQILIRYRLKNGRQVSRRYHMDLEDVLETYETFIIMKRIKRAFIRSFLSSRRRWDTFPTREMEIILCLIQWKKMP